MGGRIGFRGRSGRWRMSAPGAGQLVREGIFLVRGCLVGFVDSVTFLCVEIPLHAM